MSGDVINKAVPKWTYSFIHGEQLTHNVYYDGFVYLRAISMAIVG